MSPDAHSRRRRQPARWSLLDRPGRGEQGLLRVRDHVRRTLAVCLGDDRVGGQLVIAVRGPCELGGVKPAGHASHMALKLWAPSDSPTLVGATPFTFFR